MIKLKNLKKLYISHTIGTIAVDEINLEVENGEFLAIMGPSGCGKSTLLNMLGLMDSPTEGEYWFDNQEVSKLSPKQNSLLRKGAIGFVFQSFNLINELTVFENIELPMMYLKIPKAERIQRVDTALERMNISHRRNHYPQLLSGGQQQRVAVARAIVTNPKMILADEPTGNLDSSNGKEIMKLLLELNESGTTIVMVTHSDHDASYAHRIIHLLDGKIVTENVNDQLKV